VQLATRPHQLVQKLAQLQRGVRAVVDIQCGAAVEIPPDDHDRVPRLACCLHERTVVGGTIDQESDALGATDGAAVEVELKDTDGIGRVPARSSLGAPAACTRVSARQCVRHGMAPPTPLRL
jgi:hypothetical protein